MQHLIDTLTPLTAERFITIFGDQIEPWSFYG